MLNFFNKFFVLVVYASTLSWGGRGAVSGGGGEITNPHPARPEQIIAAIHDYAGPILLTFLNRQETLFESLPENLKRTSPYFKLFRSSSGLSIFEIVKYAKVDVRMTQPCLDAFNRPKPASIFTNQIGTICLSPFLMTDKLTERNVVVETVALVLHELTHLLDTTEDEATFIQEAFVNLNQGQMNDALAKLNQLSEIANVKILGEPRVGFKTWIENPTKITTYELELWIDQLNSTRKYNMSETTMLQFIRHQLVNEFPLIIRKVEALRDFVCTVDTKIDKSLTDECLARVTQAQTRRFSSSTDVVSELSFIQNYFRNVQDEILKVQKFRIPYTIQ